MINQYGFYVKPGVAGNDGMLIQDGYPNGPQYTCRDTARPGIAYALKSEYYRGFRLRASYCTSANMINGLFLFYLAEGGYDFSKANGPGQVCLLSQLISDFFLKYPIAHVQFCIFNFVGASDPYWTTIYTNLQGDFDMPSFRGLYSAAC